MKQLFFTAIVLFALACNNSTDRHAEISKKIAETTTDSIKLDTLISGAWNKVYILPPYAGNNQFDSLLLQHTDQIKKTSIETRDDETVLVLFNDTELLDVLSFKRQSVDFTDAATLTAETKYGYLTPTATVAYNKDAHKVFFKR